MLHTRVNMFFKSFDFSAFLRSQLVPLTEAEKRERENRRRRESPQTQQTDSNGNSENRGTGTDIGNRQTTENGTNLSEQNGNRMITVAQNVNQMISVAQQQSVRHSFSTELSRGREFTVAAATMTMHTPNLARPPTSNEAANAAPAGSLSARKRPNFSPDRSSDISPKSDTSSPFTAAAKRRRHRRISIGLTYLKDDDSAGYESDETIYSMQGYETVAIIANDDASDDSSSGEDTLEEEFTEFEIDSDADKEDERRRGKGSGESGSEEDSDIQVSRAKGLLRYKHRKWHHSGSGSPNSPDKPRVFSPQNGTSKLLRIINSRRAIFTHWQSANFKVAVL
jgi:hypothetical protein